MRNFLKAIFNLLFIFVLIGGFSQNARSDPPIPPTQEEKEEVYLIQSGDKLNIQVYGEKELTGLFTANSKGKIIYPLLGEIHVQGLSLETFQNFLTYNLSKDYLVGPQVQVSFEESLHKSVTILGHVTRSGNYFLTPNLTLVQLISKAGGMTLHADLQKIRVIRIQEGTTQKESIPVNLESVIEGKNEDFKLKMGDVVYIGKTVDELKDTEDSASTVSILGQVASPGNYRYSQDLTIIKLISKTGGFTPVAAPGNVKIIRSLKGGRTETLRVNVNSIMDGNQKDIKLKPGDLVTVGESFF